jgi:hypothetical protein
VRGYARLYLIGAEKHLFDVYAVETIVLIAELTGYRHVSFLLQHLQHFGFTEG